MAHLGDLPAFPIPMDATETGVSRRDWFAAAALQGIVSKGLEVSEDRVLTDDDRYEIMAKRAYAVADSMIAVSVSMRPKRKIVKKQRDKSPATTIDVSDNEANLPQPTVSE